MNIDWKWFVIGLIVAYLFSAQIKKYVSKVK